MRRWRCWSHRGSVAPTRSTSPLRTPCMRQLAFIRIVLAVLAFASLGGALSAQSRPTRRARDIGVPFVGTPGALNAITDVAGVEVGHVTLISGEGRLVVGKGPV